MMKKNIFIFLLINISFLCVSAQQFSIVIQDSIVVLNKKQDVVKLNLVIEKDIEDTIRLTNFCQYIKYSCMLPNPYVDKNGKMRSSNKPGLYYYVKYEDGGFLQHKWYDLSEVSDCDKRRICIDTTAMTYTINSLCINMTLPALNQDTTYFTVFPAIKYDFWYEYLKRYVLRKNREFYLTIYYVLPRKTDEESFVIASNKVKLIIK